MTALFRSLVLANLLIYWIYMFGLDFVGHTVGFSDEHFQTLRWSGVGSLIGGGIVWFYSFLLVYTLLSIGLLAFRAWAKYLFILITLLQIISTLAFGVAVHLPWESFLVSVMTHIDGFILCMILLTSIGTKFERITLRSATPPSTVGRS